MKRRTKQQLEFQQCSLCSGHHTHFSLPDQWKDDQARTYVLEIVSPGSQICRLCRDDIKKVLNNSTHTPRWERIKTSKNSNPQKCYVRDCADTTFVSGTLGTTEQMASAFAKTGIAYERNIPIPTPLCQHHYHIFAMHHQRRCTTCGTWLRYSGHRPCPKPEIVQEQYTGFESQIEPHNRVCMTCYDTQ